MDNINLEKPPFRSIPLSLWHIIFVSAAFGLIAIVILCCCFRFRIPRTKQDIEADYQRRKITKKFRERLACIKNSEMDEMNLERALERVQEDFRAEQARLRDAVNQFKQRSSYNV